MGWRSHHHDRHAARQDSNTTMGVATRGSWLQDEYSKPEHQKLARNLLPVRGVDVEWIGDPVDVAVHPDSATGGSGSMMSPLQMRDPANTYNVMTLDQAQALIPALDLFEPS